MPLPSSGEKGGWLCIVHVKVFEVDDGVKFKFLHRSIQFSTRVKQNKNLQPFQIKTNKN